MAPMSQSSIRVRQGALPTSLSALGELPDSPPASPWLYPMLPPQVLVLRLRDSIIKMGEELEKAAESEAREKESTKYYQRRMEEMKADMNELVQRELESSRRRVELVRGCCPMGPFVLPKMHSFRQPSLCRPSSAPCPPAPPRPGLAQLGCSGMGAQGNPGRARLHVLLQNKRCPPSPAPLGGQGAVEVVVPALQGMQSTPSLGYSEWSWGAPGSLQEQRIPAHPLQPQIIEPKLSLQLLAFHFSPAGQPGLGSLSALYFVPGGKLLLLLIPSKCRAGAQVTPTPFLAKRTRPSACRKSTPQPQPAARCQLAFLQLLLLFWGRAAAGGAPGTGQCPSGCPAPLCCSARRQ